MLLRLWMKNSFAEICSAPQYTVHMDNTRHASDHSVTHSLKATAANSLLHE